MRRRCGRRTRICSGPYMICILAFAILILDISYTKHRHKNKLFCLADDLEHEDDDFLAEILAEQAREEEELTRMEAEAREYDAMKARQRTGGGMPGAGSGNDSNKNKGGGPKMKMGGGAFSKLEEDLKKKEADRNNAAASNNQHQKSTQEDEVNEKENERIRQKREAAFEAELKKMNEEQRKNAKKQKAKDAKVIKRLLKAHKAGRHYQVLGIRNLEIQLGPFFFFNYSLGPIILFRVKTKQIKKVYRNLARTVHPDKNKDGRAEEAFHALESSAAILTDEKQRNDYDKRIIATRRRNNKYRVEKAVNVCEYGWKQSASTIRVTKKVLGPFSTPILVVGALII